MSDFAYLLTRSFWSVTEKIMRIGMWSCVRVISCHSPFSSPEPPFLLVNDIFRRVALGTRMVILVMNGMSWPRDVSRDHNKFIVWKVLAKQKISLNSKIMCWIIDISAQNSYQSLSKVSTSAFVVFMQNVWVKSGLILIGNKRFNNMQHGVTYKDVKKKKK